jgi:hypothetical protein
MTKTRDLADLGGGFIQAGSGAEQRTVESKLQDVVSVEDFGAISGADNSNATVNTTAFINAFKTGKTVFVPKGEYRVNQIDCVANSLATVRLLGEGDGSTISRVGGNATFYISSTSCTLTLEKVRFVGTGNGSSVHYDYATDTGKNTFRDCSFIQDQYGLNVEPLAVGWIIEGCVFNDCRNTAQYFLGGCWACRFENNYTWYCNKGFYAGSGHSSSYRSSVFEYNSSEAIIFETAAAGNDITDFVFDSIFFEANCSANAVPIIRLTTSAAARIRNISFNNCYLTIAQQATFACSLTAGGGGNIANILFSNTTFNVGTLAVTNTNSSALSFLNCYFSDLSPGILSANTRYVPLANTQQPVVTVNNVATVGELQANKLTILQDSAAAFTLRPREGDPSTITYSNVSLLHNVNNGVNTASVDLPSMLSGFSVASDQRVYLVTVIVKNGTLDSSSYTRIITMYGELTTGINVASLSTVNTATAANVNFTRTDPGGGAAHQLTISGNNIARIKSINAILLGTN